MDKTITLSEKEASLRLEDFEKGTDIYSFSVEGQSIWQLLRFEAADRLQNLNWDRPRLKPKEWITANLRGLKLWRLFSLSRKRYLVQTYYSGLRQRKGTTFEDVWFDDLLRSIPEGAKLTMHNVSGYGERVPHETIPSGYDNTLFYTVASFLARVFPLRSTQYSVVSQLIFKHLSLTHFSENLIRRRVSVFIWLSRIFQIFLTIARPRNVLVVDTEEFALLRACKKKQVHTIELQHGIMSRYHPRNLSSAALIYDGQLQWPDVVAVSGEYWQKELQNTILDKKNLVKVVGNATLESYRERRRTRTTSKLRLIVTTQPFGQSELLKFFQQCLSSTKVEFELIFKLHPISTHAGELGQLLTDSRVKILSALEGESTFELIAKSDFHLSIASACHYDALSMGTPTVVLDLPGHELMDSLIEEGGARKISTPADFVEMITSKKVVESRPEYFCRSGHIDEMKRLLRE